MRRPLRVGLRAAVGLLAAVLLLVTNEAGARAAQTTTTNCTTHWTNTAGGDWSVGGNWSTGTVPTPSSDVCIDTAGTYTVTVEGTVSVDALVVGTSTTTNPGVQTLQLTDLGCTTGSAPNLTTTSTGVNDVVRATGIVDMTSTCSGGNSGALTVSSALPLVNMGTIQVDAGTGGARAISGPLTNSTGAAVNVNAATTYTPAGSTTFDNLGAVNLSAALTVASTPTTTTPAFTDDTGGTITGSGSGELVVMGPDIYNQAAGTTTGNPVVVINGTSVFAVSGGASTIWAEGASSVLEGTINSGQTYQVEGASSGGPATTATLSGNVTDNGVIDLNSAGFNGDHDSLVAPTGTTLTVGTTGVLQSDAGTGGPRTLQGAITISQGGQVNINVGTSWSMGTFTNGGTITIADALTFLVPATSPVSTFVNGATGTIATTTDSKQGNLFLVGGTFNEAGTTTGGPVYVENASLKYSGAGPAAINSWGTTKLLSNIANGQTLTVQAVGCVTDSNLTVGKNLNLAGAIVLTATNCHGGNASVSMTSTTGKNYLTVASTGSLTWAAGTGGNRTLNGKLINDGTVGPSGVYPLSIVGTFTQTTTGTMQANVSATGADTITVSGAAHLAGALVAVPVASFTPTHGESWTGIVKASHIYQNFASTTGPGGTWTSAVQSSSVTLTYP